MGTAAGTKVNPLGLDDAGTIEPAETNKGRTSGDCANAVTPAEQQNINEIEI